MKPPTILPSVTPPLDPGFRPMVLAYREALGRADADGADVVRIAIERENGLVSTFETKLPGAPANAAEAFLLAERLVKCLLWSRGGWKITFQGPAELGRRLRAVYAHDGQRAFDVRLMARVYERPFKFVLAGPDGFPETRDAGRLLGGHVDGCRIGFDLGASDYKIAAVKDGQPLFSEEIPWNPGEQADPDYHYRHIREGLEKAASRLPRVDAVGGSAAGIYIDNQVRIASLFRAVPDTLFEEKIKPLFLRLRREWGVPFEVINDGEVTALAGMLSLGVKAVLGIAMGSSQAAGFLNAQGYLPGRLDELAFVPVDISPEAAVDEWSGDRGVGANYFSQQAVDRLAPAAGLVLPEGMRVPDRLKRVQELMARGDERAARIYETIGVYLGYTIPWYEVFYEYHHLIVLGRVMSGPGGKIIVDRAGEVLSREFPETAARVRLHLLDERSRRVGQAVAAASLPESAPPSGLQGDPK